jgi:hypothetical protein
MLLSVEVYCQPRNFNFARYFRDEYHMLPSEYASKKDANADHSG